MSFHKSYPGNPQLYDYAYHSRYTITVGTCKYTVTQINHLAWMIIQYSSLSSTYPLLLNDILSYIHNNIIHLSSLNYQRDIISLWDLSKWNTGTILELIVKLGNAEMLYRILKYYPTSGANNINSNICSYIPSGIRAYIPNDTIININILYFILDKEAGAFYYLVDKIKLLINHGVNINAKYITKDGDIIATPLSLLINNKNINNNDKITIIKLFLDVDLESFNIYDLREKHNTLYNLLKYKISLSSLQGACLLQSINTDIDITIIPGHIIFNLLSNKSFKLLYDNIINYKKYILEAKQKVAIMEKNMHGLMYGNLTSKK